MTFLYFRNKSNPAFMYCKKYSVYQNADDKTLHWYCCHYSAPLQCPQQSLMVLIKINIIYSISKWTKFLILCQRIGLSQLLKNIGLIGIIQPNNRNLRHLWEISLVVAGGRRGCVFVCFFLTFPLTYKIPIIFVFFPYVYLFRSSLLFYM